MRKAFLVLVFIWVVVQTKAIGFKGLDSLNVYQRVDASYIFGGQIYNDNFIYNPGVSFQNAFGFKITDDVEMGFCYGIQSINNKRFIPLCFEVTGFKDKAQPPFIKMQAGYAIGWHVGEISQAGYNYKGGLFIDAGIGKKIPVNINYSVLFHISYRHQFARAEYDIFDNKKYSELLNYDMVVISLSLLRD